MNIKKHLRLLKTNKTKAIFLAGLMGLIPSCKMERNEPENPTTQNSVRTTTQINNVPLNPVDSFMQHMSSVDNAVFYEPTEDTHCFLFHTDYNTNSVKGITELRDMKDNDCSIQNQYDLNRLDNTCVNGSANFIVPQYWVYNVKYSNEYGGGNWKIDCVTDAEYNSKYKNMTNQDLADLAYSRILSKRPSDTGHAESIRDAILNGEGKWEQDDSFYVTFNSNGWKQNLRYSDFGTFNVMFPEYYGSFTSMYSGGMNSNEVHRSMIQPQTFKATAYANVTATNRKIGSEQELIVSTGRDSATFTIDALQNETIVMPFKNWYKVTIIRTNNSVISSFEDINAIPETWQLPHPNMQETGYREGTQENGLAVKDGLYGIEHEDGFLTGTAVNYYTDETGYIEFVGQGYRQDWLPNKKIQFTFSFGGTNRPKPDNQITTGLNEVYCVPARNNIRSHQR